MLYNQCTGVAQNRVSGDKIRCSTKTQTFTNLNKSRFNNLRFKKEMGSYVPISLSLNFKICDICVAKVTGNHGRP